MSVTSKVLSVGLIVIILLGVLGFVFKTEFLAAFQYLSNPSIGSLRLYRDDEGGVIPKKIGLMGLQKESTDIVTYAKEHSFSAHAIFTGAENTASTSLSSWSVILTDTDSGETTDLGTGNTPQFFMRDGKEYLLFLNPNGIAVTDLSTRMTQVTYLPVYDDTRGVAAISKDGMHLVLQNKDTHGFFLFDVQQVTPFVINPKRAIHAPLTSVAFVENNLFAIQQYEERATLRMFDIEDEGEGKVVYSLPVSDYFYILIP
jgi:hypothetical protein